MKKADSEPEKVGIIGYGTIGSYLVNRIREDRCLAVGFIYDIDPEKTKRITEYPVLSSLEDFGETEVDLIVEVADSECVKRYAPFVLQKKELLIFSVTALAEEELKERLDQICKTYGTRYHIPHGAIIGLDGIRDGRNLIRKVSITTVKNPKNLAVRDRKITGRTVLYEGPTRNACHLYPRNVNVHACLAISGLGFDRTISKLIADPEVDTLSHEIEVEGEGLKWRVEVQSKALGGVSGSYTPESAYQTVRRISCADYGMNLI